MNEYEWIRNLKKGDIVVSWERNYGGHDSVNGVTPKYIYRRLEVKNITPKGRIRLSNGTLVDPDDKNSIKDANIQPLTDEILKKEEKWRESRAKKGEVLQLFEKANITPNKILNKYSPEKLEQLKEFLLSFK